MNKNEISEQSLSKNPKISKFMYVHKVLVVILCCLAFALVFFHRQMPAIVTAEMSDYYQVDSADLTIFSTMFLWSYAVLQLIGGPLSDLLNPVILLVVMLSFASIGSLIDGFEKSIPIGVFGRFIVGVGCGPIFVPICRLTSNWFEPKWYSVIVGLVLAAGGAGGIIAQSPLQAFEEKYGWRWCFYGITILGVLVAIIFILVVRSSPSKFHYPNPSSVYIPTKKTAKELFLSLLRAFAKVVVHFDFWMISLYASMIVGQYYSMTGLWAGLYIGDVYPNLHKGNSLLSLSIAMIVGCIGFPMLSNLLHTRRWLLIVCSILGLAMALVFIFIKPTLNFGQLFALFFFWGVFTGGSSSIAVSLFAENLEPVLVSTAMGGGNALTFFLGAIIQTITGSILSHYGKKVPGTKRYTTESYRNAIWIPNVCYTVLSIVGLILLRKDGKFARPKPKKEAKSDSDQGEIPPDNAPSQDENEQIENLDKGPSDSEYDSKEEVSFL